MSSTASRAIALFGTDEPVQDPVILRAGPLSCALDGGNLRHITLGGREAIRAISMITRDRNWGTFNPAIEDLAVDQRADGFSVSYRATCSGQDQTLVYEAEITGDAGGTLSFAVRGEALTDFVTNRAGFVVLHGVEGIAGRPVTVEHVDGTTAESRFPDIIDPVQPFKDIRSLTHEVFPGVRVTCRMEGDAYEMEDQRNWMDASYKTYIRPLALPWPYTLSKGERLDLKVTLAVNGSLPAVGAGGAGEPVQVELGDRVVGRMPKLALVVPAHLAPLALDHADLLRTAPFRVHCFSLLDGVTTASLDTTVRQLEAFGALGGAGERLLEAVLPCRDSDGIPTDDLRVLERDIDLLATAVRRSGVAFQRIALSPAADLKSTPPGSVWPKAPSFEALAEKARQAFPGIAIGGGFFGSFTELNRKRPPGGLFDFLGHAIFPTVHAGDDVSVTEGLEALPSIIRSTQAIIGQVPYVLYPTAISMRHNPYGQAPLENPQQTRLAMARVDPRDRAILGAAWYAGLIAIAAPHGLDTLCLGAAVGPSGIVATRQPHGQPWVEERRAQVLPSWHVLTGHAALASQDLVEVRSSSMQDVQALAVRSGRTTVLWLTNLTGRRQQVRIAGQPVAGQRSWTLEAATFEAACVEPHAAALPAHAVAGEVVELDAYAVTRIDITA
ncbi:MAG TPA: hypothetical protein VHL31_06450 [Geminicoccus sp.]|jgi:hypothetical protein|uniref:hypothetical protein n=1 Tax=Geminicoccus sp. TaxID=2024832 RepID=UPI002E3330FE|nr:hypothetical protein [Geminicoccus sp.]HEX2525932.1 hypothetical protein [Geminicoccus sp.]